MKSLLLLQDKLPNLAFSDNDSLASIVARETGAQLLILLTDVDGLYDKPPSCPDAKV